MFKVPENFRVKTGALGSDETFMNNGAFLVPINNNTLKALCIVSDGHNWEHVFVSLYNKDKNMIKRCPTWEEMCYIKDIFWDVDDTVIQYHPPKKDWVNNHPYCLHLWRPIDSEIIRPPFYLVGIKK